MFSCHKGMISHEIQNSLFLNRMNFMKRRIDLNSGLKSKVKEVEILVDDFVTLVGIQSHHSRYLKMDSPPKVDQIIQMAIFSFKQIWELSEVHI